MRHRFPTPRWRYLGVRLTFSANLSLGCSRERYVEAVCRISYAPPYPASLGCPHGLLVRMTDLYRRNHVGLSGSVPTDPNGSTLSPSSLE